MNRFLQLHLLTSYGPANLNRDDTGRPKTAVMGGCTRLRVSSQSLKRAWRTSDLFKEALGDHKGTRTKEKGVHVYRDLMAGGVAAKDAHAWAAAIAEQFGKRKAKNKADPEVELEIEQLAHFGPDEQRAIAALVETLIARGSEPTADELTALRMTSRAVDIGLFGRMLADRPVNNVEAAAQVAHALSVHRSAVEDDFFTAVDDLNTREDDAGAGHMGVTEFGAGVFYLYLCIDRRLLLDNLGGDRELMNRALQTLTACAATVAPTGKQASFGSRAYASYVLAELGNQQPRALSVAFLKPVTGEDMLEAAINAIEKTQQKMDAAYGPCAAARSVMNIHSEQGTLSAVQAFVAQD